MCQFTGLLFVALNAAVHTAMQAIVNYSYRMGSQVTSNSLTSTPYHKYN